MRSVDHTWILSTTTSSLKAPWWLSTHPEVSSTQPIEIPDGFLCRNRFMSMQTTCGPWFRHRETVTDFDGNNFTLNLFKQLLLTSTLLYCKMTVEIAKLVGFQLVSWFSTKVVELTNQLENSTIHCCPCCRNLLQVARIQWWCPCRSWTWTLHHSNMRINPPLPI